MTPEEMQRRILSLERQLAVFHAYRDKLASMSEPSAYPRVSRDALERAVRLFLFEMDKVSR